MINLSGFVKIAYFPALLISATVFIGDVSAQTQPQNSITPIAQASDQANNEAIKTKATAIIELLSEGNYAQVRESISSELAEKWSPKAIEEIWNNLTQVTGSPRKQLGIEVISTVNADLVIIDTEFENTTDNFIITFDKNQNIVGIDFPKTDTIDQIAEIFVNSLAKNDYSRARGYLHPFLKTEIFPEQVKGKWDNLIETHGQIKRIVNTEIISGSASDQVNLVTVTVEFENDVSELFVVFDDDKRIIAVDTPSSN